MLVNILAPWSIWVSLLVSIIIYVHQLRNSIVAGYLRLAMVSLQLIYNVLKMSWILFRTMGTCGFCVCSETKVESMTVLFCTKGVRFPTLKAPSSTNKAIYSAPNTIRYFFLEFRPQKLDRKYVVMVFGALRGDLQFVHRMSLHVAAQFLPLVGYFFFVVSMQIKQIFSGGMIKKNVNPNLCGSNLKIRTGHEYTWLVVSNILSFP